MSEQKFWKSEKGNAFADACSSSAEVTDQDMLGYFQTSGTDLFKRVLNQLSKHGFPDYSEAHILDIGCSTGGKLAIFESLGTVYDFDYFYVMKERNYSIHPIPSYWNEYKQPTYCTCK